MDRGFYGFCFLTKMTASLKSIEGFGDIADVMGEIGRRARAAARVLALAPAEQKDRALELMAAAVRAQASSILVANVEDVAEARSAGVTEQFLIALSSIRRRVEAIAKGIEAVRALKDPVGTITKSWTRPNGIRIERVRVPLGVIGIVYESRPNVTADAGVLCLKAGTPRSFAAALTACAPAEPSWRRWQKVCEPPVCRRLRSRLSRRVTVPPSE